MILELRVIHVLIKVAVSTSAEAAELVRLRAVLVRLIHNIKGRMYV